MGFREIAGLGAMFAALAHAILQPNPQVTAPKPAPRAVPPPIARPVRVACNDQFFTPDDDEDGPILIVLVRKEDKSM